MSISRPAPTLTRMARSARSAVLRPERCRPRRLVISTSTSLSAGDLTVNTTGFPSTAHVRLAVVVAGAATITSITDVRVAFPVLGSIADGINFSLGTNTGSQIGTAANQKLAFFGNAPIAQPTLGPAVAGSTYTANEQTMLQAVYNALRNLGLGS